jgi:hypothetical protein
MAWIAINRHRSSLIGRRISKQRIPIRQVSIASYRGQRKFTLASWEEQSYPPPWTLTIRWGGCLFMHDGDHLIVSSQRKGKYGLLTLYVKLGKLASIVKLARFDVMKTMPVLC